MRAASQVDVRADDVEAIAFAHGTQVEADATHLWTRYAGIVYRAQIGGAA